MTSETTRVITDDVRKEADKWRDLSDEMSAVYANPVGNDGLELGVFAFFIGPTELISTAMHFEAYTQFYAEAKDLVKAAATEWLQLGEALDRMADEFDRTDQTAEVDLEAVYTEPATNGVQGPSAAAQQGEPQDG
ncbi:MAG: hypothetical protein HOU81_01100 [Hamadaea sp.]|uniref:hypothetical protein n=1 Tax=Hamadaea sp. TaxID=2024425 RepID=UPI0017F8A7A3|nr:hypothetical protein [Hamadaea sp.]NUR69395.1 hypothetical protein [Hamadaea sp.]NUT23212.1 hypothetical protein [Hamadaea sp.]